MSIKEGAIPLVRHSQDRRPQDIRTAHHKERPMRYVYTYEYFSSLNYISSQQATRLLIIPTIFCLFFTIQLAYHLGLYSLFVLSSDISLPTRLSECIYGIISY